METQRKTKEESYLMTKGDLNTLVTHCYVAGQADDGFDIDYWLNKWKHKPHANQSKGGLEGADINSAAKMFNEPFQRQHGSFGEMCFKQGADFASTFSTLSPSPEKKQEGKKSCPQCGGLIMELFEGEICKNFGCSYSKRNL